MELCLSLGGNDNEAARLRYVGGRLCWFGLLAARAQQPAMPTIGYLGSETPDLFATRLTAFRQGLGVMGFDEGRNVAIEFVWADGQPDRLHSIGS